MSEKVEEAKVVETEGTGTTVEEIHTTDFVEPNSKGRRIVKYVVGGLAALISGIAGFILGKNSKDDKNDETQDTTSEKTEE